MDDAACKYENRIVAITGASGYLASVLIEALRKTSARILRVSRKDLPSIPGTESQKADLRLQECWEGIVSKADVIFHLAGNTSVYHATENPSDSLSSTVLPITQLIKAAQIVRCRPQVVFASTATVYGLANSFPVSENVHEFPVTNYDIHKLFAEKQLELVSNQGILDGVSLRLANVYGPSSGNRSTNDRGVLNKIAELALKGSRLRLYGDGKYLRDYVYIDDVVRAFMIAGVSEEVAGRSFNVASGKGITVKEAFDLVAKKAEDITGRQVHIDNVPWPANADPIEFRNYVADISNFNESTGWRPLISFDEGVTRMVASFARRHSL